MKWLLCVALLGYAMPVQAADDQETDEEVASEENYQATGVILLPREEYEAIPLIPAPDISKKPRVKSDPNSTIIYKK